MFPRFHHFLFPITYFLLFRAREIGFEDALGGDRVEGGLEPGAARAGGAQGMLGIVRSEPLVHELDAEAEAAVQPLGKTAGQPADRVLAAVLAGGHADHQQGGAPFRDQALDRGKARAVLRGRDGGQRVRQPGFEIADGDADALGAEIEGENGPRSRVRGEG